MKQPTILFACMTIVGLILVVVLPVVRKEQYEKSATSLRNKNNPNDLSPFRFGYQPFLLELELREAIDQYLEGRDLGDLLARYGPLEEWDVSYIRNFANLFNGIRNPLAQHFNSNISMWNMSNAIYLHDMFHNATMFNGNLTLWQVDNVRTFNGMFENAIQFQGHGLEHWNVSNGEKFMVMFAETINLRTDLDVRHWNLQRAQNVKAMFRRSNFGSNTPQNQLCPWKQYLSNSHDNVNVYAMFWQSNCPQTDIRPSLNLVQDGYFCGWCPALQITETLTTAPTSNATNTSTNTENESEQQQQQVIRRKPNILFLITDQQRFDTLRRVQDELWYYNNVTKIETPYLDRLSKSGAYFRNAYCQCSVCAPARATLRTGCTVERTGIQHNDLIYEYHRSTLFTQRVESVPTLDEILTQNGYISEHYGKWHLPKIWWDKGNAIQYNDYHYETSEFDMNHHDSISRKVKRYLKFQQSQGHIPSRHDLSDGMQTDTFTGFPYTPSVELDSRYHSPTGTRLTTDDGLFEGWQTTQPNVLGVSALNASYTNTYVIADTALKAMNRLLMEQQEQEEVANDTKPFFLTVSFHNPHPPMVPAATEALQYYQHHQDSLFVSHNLYDDMTNADYKYIAENVPNYRNRTQIQAWTALYYALITEIDEWVGTFVQQLEQANQLNNTLIIFTSDHGEMLGAHGKREKNTFYEEAARVPLLLSFPGIIPSNSTFDTLTSHLDIAATILDYVGLSSLDNSDGTSLRPTIDQQSYNRDYDEDLVVAEWDYRKPLPTDHEILERSIDERPSLMIRKHFYKLFFHKQATSSKIDMMYDLQQDPFELHNLLGHNAQTSTIETQQTAEYLRCLLLEWMTQMDGGNDNNMTIRYYSDPASNYWQGSGDISEVRQRQSWPALDFWISHTCLEFGRPIWNGQSLYVRNQYVYLGTRTEGSITMQFPYLEQKYDDEDDDNNGDSSPFRLTIKNHPNDGLPKNLTLYEKECVRLQVLFESPTYPTTSMTKQTTLVIRDPISNTKRSIPIAFATDVM